MAVVTVTAAAGIPLPKAHHVGVQALHFQYEGGGTSIGTPGDTIILGKLPNKGTVLDMASRVDTNADTSSAVVFFITKGNPASETTTLAILGTISNSATLGAVMFRPGAVWAPYKVSLSDDDGTQYALLKVRFAAGTATTSMSMDGYITFAMNAEPS